LVVGTRPEAIKLSPIAHALAARGEAPHLLVTGQHPGLELGDHQLDGFDATPLNTPGQPDPILHTELVRAALRRLLPMEPPEMLIVQGDTSSALGGALAAREMGIPLAHVEAGLRTYDPNEPWPEEENRVAIDRIADLLFAPTSSNAANLRRDRMPGRIHITGNSGIDALAQLVGRIPAKPRRRWPWQPFRLLVTCHRRENWGAGFDGVAAAITALCQKRVVANVLMPPNPMMTERMTRLLGGKQGICLVPPLSHRATVDAMRDADLILSDSGGMQEEAPALGVPLLILRKKTERPEGLATGTMALVGTDPSHIVATVEELQRNRSALAAMRMPCLPFGDGNAAPRIARYCLMFLRDGAAAYDSRIA
jgi:UDP-N-acetylglucosamine 2-epimerase (non-hydrolysing)